MKELLKSLYIFGIERRDNYYPILEDEAFDVWYEQNKSKIDDAIESHLESQGKVTIKGVKVTRELGMYELQSDSQDTTPAN